MAVGYNPFPGKPSPWALGLGDEETHSFAMLQRNAREMDGGVAGPASNRLLEAHVLRYGATPEHFQASWDPATRRPVLATDEHGNFIRGAKLDAEWMVTNASTLASMFRLGLLPDAASGGQAARGRFSGIANWREYLDAEFALTGADVNRARAGDRMRGYTRETPLPLGNDSWEMGLLAMIRDRAAQEGWSVPAPGVYAVPAQHNPQVDPPWMKMAANYNGTGGVSFLEILPDTRKAPVQQPDGKGGDLETLRTALAGAQQETQALQSKLAEAVKAREDAQKAELLTRGRVSTLLSELEGRAKGMRAAAGTTPKGQYQQALLKAGISLEKAVAEFREKAGP